ncbi:MAG: hypothetical protein K6G30_12055 [Acetatifactor sp.]|nr:hypothetical protein [Acetatifactor sp.]
MNKAIEQIMCKIPIGTRLRLVDDYPDVCHEVIGYKLLADDAYILFRDGTELHMARLEKLAEVLPDGNVA